MGADAVVCRKIDMLRRCHDMQKSFSVNGDAMRIWHPVQLVVRDSCDLSTCTEEDTLDHTVCSSENRGMLLQVHVPQSLGAAADSYLPVMNHPQSTCVPLHVRELINPSSAVGV